MRVMGPGCQVWVPSVAVSALERSTGAKQPVRV